MLRVSCADNLSFEFTIQSPVDSTTLRGHTCTPYHSTPRQTYKTHAHMIRHETHVKTHVSTHVDTHANTHAYAYSYAFAYSRHMHFVTRETLARTHHTFHARVRTTVHSTAQHIFGSRHCSNSHQTSTMKFLGSARVLCVGSQNDRSVFRQHWSCPCGGRLISCIRRTWSHVFERAAHQCLQRVPRPKRQSLPRP